MTTSDNAKIVVRAGTEADCDKIMTLLKDLAIYEGMLDQVKITSEDLKRDAFYTNPPVVHTVVAELTPPPFSPPPEESTRDPSLPKDNQNIVGYALYYYTYSAWKGKAIHLEDLFVRPEYRFRGIGQKFFQYLSKISIEGNCARLSFECIKWNEPAMKFYRKHGARDVTVEEHWHSYRIGREALENLVKE